MIMKLVAERQKKILKCFDSYVKSIDLDYLKEIYAKDTVFQNAAREITSPKFRRMIVRSMDNTVAFLYETGNDFKRCQPLFATAQKQQLKAQASLLKATTHHIGTEHPESNKFGKVPPYSPKELARDFESFVEAVSRVFLAKKLAIESIVRQVHIADEFGMAALRFPKPAKSENIITRRVHRGEVLLSEEYLSELLTSVQQKTIQNAPKASDKAKKFKEWTGDQPISYDGKNLFIGSKKAKIPKEGDATIRQILLMKLVEDYNTEKSVGVDTVAFMQELRKVQIRPSMRALETAANALNDEIEIAFQLCKFVKASRSVARIIKRDK